MWVVKLGGSLLGQPELPAWLALLARVADGRIVIVPGGGVFADAVRAAQADGGYDDATAHRMALLAMEQFAWVLQSLQTDLVLVSSELEIAERSWQHRAMLWLPSRMVLADETVPKTWEVTSDSLAAWLAQKLGAERLILVKHGINVDPAVSLQSRVEQGVLDQAFLQFGAALSCSITLIDKSAHNDFSRMLAAGPAPLRMA